MQRYKTEKRKDLCLLKTLTCISKESFVSVFNERFRF